MTPYLWCQLLAWTAHTLIGLAFTATFNTITPKYALFSVYASMAGFGATHLLRRFLKQWRWMEMPVPRRILVGLGSSLATAFCLVVLMSFSTMFLFHFFTWAQFQWSVFFAVWFNWNCAILFWTTVYGLVQLFRNYRDAELERLRLELIAQEAQLGVLRSQVNPHFIFNCLNSLRGLILEDPRRAQEMVTQLSGILRYSLRSDRTATVPLGSELEVVRDYLRLEQIRFEERLRFRFDIEPGLEQTSVPPMLLQTLVENGVKFGISRLPQGGEIVVEAKRDGDAVRLRVRNTGQLVSSTESTAIGLKNTEARLRLLYGELATFHLRNEDAAHVTAEISLPEVVCAR